MTNIAQKNHNTKQINNKIGIDSSNQHIVPAPIIRTENFVRDRSGDLTMIHSNLNTNEHDNSMHHFEVFAMHFEVIAKRLEMSAVQNHKDYDKTTNLHAP